MKISAEAADRNRILLNTIQQKWKEQEAVMNPNELRCSPSKPDEKCFNCKKKLAQSQMYVNTKNSTDKACIYVPISLQEKV